MAKNSKIILLVLKGVLSGARFSSLTSLSAPALLAEEPSEQYDTHEPERLEGYTEQVTPALLVCSMEHHTQCSRCLYHLDLDARQHNRYCSSNVVELSGVRFVAAFHGIYKWNMI